LIPPLAFVADTQSWKRTFASAVEPEATPVNEPRTPTAIGVAADVLPVLPVLLMLPVLPAAAGLAEEDGEEEDEELHPARARAARTIAGKLAHAPLRRNLVIAALPFLAGSPHYWISARADRGI
jgi:hypothetical protein